MRLSFTYEQSRKASINPKSPICCSILSASYLPLTNSFQQTGKMLCNHALKYIELLVVCIPHCALASHHCWRTQTKQKQKKLYEMLRLLQPWKIRSSFHAVSLSLSLSIYLSLSEVKLDRSRMTKRTPTTTATKQIIRFVNFSRKQPRNPIHSLRTIPVRLSHAKSAHLDVHHRQTWQPRRRRRVPLTTWTIQFVWPWAIHRPNSRWIPAACHWAHNSNNQIQSDRMHRHSNHRQPKQWVSRISLFLYKDCLLLVQILFSYFFYLHSYFCSCVFLHWWNKTKTKSQNCLLCYLL